MGYMALYRKWRPQTFDEVQGQDAIVRTLRNQLLYNRIGHAYLFCGTRGTGKTSVAKLFAKAVNCENPTDGNPCGVCPSCLAIQEQRSLDVQEIDAASNNGVENIRDIRDQVQYSPANGRYKVFIIDEAHMLSPGAFNALLKTLEEPPSYVIFILATTERHKIPVTILSRCQKYDFKRISVGTITDYLADLMAREQVDVEERALAYIARAADGSMRDALSLLDQCIAFYLGQRLTYENVLEVLGTADLSVFSALLRALLRQDTLSVLDTVDQIIMEGRELPQFLADFLWYLRNLLLLKDQEGAEDSLDLSAENIAALKEEAQMVETTTLFRYIRVLSALSAQLRNATQQRVLLEVGFIKLCRPDMETDTESLAERIRVLEEQLAAGLQNVLAAGQISAGVPGVSGVAAAGGVPDVAGAAGMGGVPVAGLGGVPGVAGSGNPAVQAAAGDPNAQEEVFRRIRENFSPAEIADLNHIKEHWGELVAELPENQMRYFLTQDKDETWDRGRVRLSVSPDNGSLLQLLFSPACENIAIDYFRQNNQKNLHELSRIVSEKVGKTVEFICMEEGAGRADPSRSISLSDISRIQDKVHFPITEES